MKKIRFAHVLQLLPEFLQKSDQGGLIMAGSSRLSSIIKMVIKYKIFFFYGVQNITGTRICLEARVLNSPKTQRSSQWSWPMNNYKPDFIIWNSYVNSKEFYPELQEATLIFVFSHL